MPSPTLPSRGRARLMFLSALAMAAACAGLLAAAALVPAPHIVLPFLILICIGCPMAAAYELPVAITALRTHAARASLKRSLDALPEVPHPHGY
jgi:hypothetical protein